MGAVIEVLNVSKRYSNGTLALDGVTLDIKSGEIFSILGPNGAGKTTLIKLMIGLLVPTNGAIRMFGENIFLKAKVKEIVGVVHQLNSFDEFLSVGDNLTIHGAFYGLGSKQTRDRASSLLDIFELTAKWNTSVSFLSGGERRKLQIVRSLVTHPKVLFLDEPSMGLDVQARRDFHELMRLQGLEKGTTIIWTTHYLEEIENVCNQVAVLLKGKLICVDSPLVLSREFGGDSVIITLSSKEQQIRLLDILLENGHRASLLEDTKIIIRMKNANLDLMPFVTQWIRAGFEVKSISVTPTSLEEAYLHIIERGTK